MVIRLPCDVSVRASFRISMRVFIMVWGLCSHNILIGLWKKTVINIFNQIFLQTAFTAHIMCKLRERLSFALINKIYLCLRLQLYLIKFSLWRLFQAMLTCRDIKMVRLHASFPFKQLLANRLCSEDLYKVAEFLIKLRFVFKSWFAKYDLLL